VGNTGPTGATGSTVHRSRRVIRSDRIDRSTGFTPPGYQLLQNVDNVLQPYPVVDESFALGSTLGSGQSTTSTSSALIILNGLTGTASISSELTLRGTSALINTTNMVPLTIGDTNTGPIQLSPSGVTGLTILGNGFVGIGKTIPLFNLDIAVTLRCLPRYPLAPCCSQTPDLVRKFCGKRIL